MTLPGVGAPRAPRAPRPAGGAAAGGGPPAASGAAAPPPRVPRAPLPATPPAPRPVVPGAGGMRFQASTRALRAESVDQASTSIRTVVGPPLRFAVSAARRKTGGAGACEKVKPGKARAIAKTARIAFRVNMGSEYNAGFTAAVDIPCISPKDIRTEPDNRNMLGPSEYGISATGVLWFS